MLTAQLRHLHPSFALLQIPNDLLFAVSALLHLPSSRSIYERTPGLIGRDLRKQVRKTVERRIATLAGERSADRRAEELGLQLGAEYRSPTVDEAMGGVARREPDDSTWPLV